MEYNYSMGEQLNRVELESGQWWEYLILNGNYFWKREINSRFDAQKRIDMEVEKYII